MNLQSGWMVTENLRLVRQIGEGGMGSVWVAEHLTLDTEVAVKFMAPELATHPDAVARFTREAKSAARMRSPHVVKIFDYGFQKGGIPYMTMELLEGEDLEDRVSRAGRLSLKDTVEVVSQLSKALSEAHALGVVHRDIKPDNVFLMTCGDDFFVKMLDFGIAKSSGAGVRVTNSGTTIGTPIYMSPEQILSAKDVDYRCDLWSLAVVAYYCLTGRVPFEGETFGAVCIAIDRGRMKLPSQLRSEVPRAVDEWFTKALARDMNERFRSAKEAADAFAAAMAGASPTRSVSLSFTLPRLPSLARARAGQQTLTAAFISATTSRGASRRHLATFASVAAMVLLAIGAMDLGRTLFGRPVGTTTLLASPPLAYAEAPIPYTLPPRAPVAMAEPSALRMVDSRPSAAAKTAPLGALPADEGSPTMSLAGQAAQLVAAVRPAAHPSDGTWSRRAVPAARRGGALVANAVPAPEPAVSGARSADVDPTDVGPAGRLSAVDARDEADDARATGIDEARDAGARLPDAGGIRASSPAASIVPASGPDDTPVL
jgi:serine/threonine protein kinase